MKAVEKKLYRHGELESQLDYKLSESDYQWTLDAEVKGARNMPALSETNLKPYVAQFHHNAQAIVNSLGTILQPPVLISEVIESEKNMDRKLRELTNKLTPIKEEYKLKKRLDIKNRPFGKWRIPLVRAATCIPLLADGFLNIGCFQAYGYSFIEAFGVSILLAGAFALLAHYFDRLIGIGNTAWQRRGIAAGILMTLACFFYLIADLRAEALTGEAASNGAAIHYSPLPIALLSGLLFITSLAISHFGSPTKDQRKAAREYEEFAQKHQAIVGQRKDAEQAIETVKSAHEELVQVNGSIYVYGGKLEEMVVNRTQAAYCRWLSVNMMFRPDGHKPIAFDNDEYPFIFQRNFKTIDFK